MKDVTRAETDDTPFVLGERLGTGASADVFVVSSLAARFEVPAGVPVAVKLLKQGLEASPEAVARFRREAELGLRVRHPNVVRTFATGIDTRGEAPRPFILCEAIAGENLGAVLARGGTRPEVQVRHIAREAARGLAALHQARVVHRDLTLANVLVTTDDRIIIVDLGIAHDLQTGDRAADRRGTPGFVAPEQQAGGAIDGRADLYARGVILSALAAPSSDAANALDVTRTSDAVRESAAARPVAATRLSPFMRALIDSLLEVDVAARFPSSALLVETLEAGENSSWWRQRVGSGAQSARVGLRRDVRPRATPLVGRQRELEALHAARAATTAERGNVVVVRGDAGLGRTRLLSEFVETLDRASQPPQIIEIAVAADGGDVAGRLARELSELFGRDVLDARGRDTATPEAISGILVDAITMLARRAPLVLTIDDAHHATGTHRHLLVALSCAVRDVPLFVVLATTPGSEIQGRLDTLSHESAAAPFVTLDLAPLAEADVQALLWYLGLTSSLASTLAAATHEATAGAPRAIEEVVAAWIETGELVRDGAGRFVATGAQPIPRPPRSALGSLHGKLARLTPSERQLVACLAAAREPLDADLIAAATGLATWRVLVSLENLARAHLVISRDQAFRCDPLAARDLAAWLGAEAEREVHRMLAAAYATRHPDSHWAARAWHLYRGHGGSAGDAAVAKAVAELGRAAHLEGGLELVRLALESSPRIAPQLRRELRMAEANACDLLGRDAEHARAMEEVLAIAIELGDRTGRIAAELKLISVAIRIPDLQTCERRGMTLMALADEGNDPATRATALNVLGTVRTQQRQDIEARRLLEEGLAIAEGLGDAVLIARLAVNLGVVMRSVGDLEHARELFTRARRLLAPTNEARGQLSALLNLTYVESALGNAERALELITEHVTLCRQVGARNSLAKSLMIASNVFFQLERYEAAEAHARQALELAIELEEPLLLTGVRAMLGWLCLMLGDNARARRLWEASLADATASQDPRSMARAHARLANVAFQEGRLSDSVEHCGRALAIEAEFPVRHMETEALELRGRTYFYLGRLDEAAADFRRALTLTNPSSKDHLAFASAYLGLIDPSAERPDPRSIELHLWMLRVERDWIVARGTGDAALAAQARAVLEEKSSRMAEPWRTTIREGIPVHREILQGNA